MICFSNAGGNSDITWQDEDEEGKNGDEGLNNINSTKPKQTEFLLY